MRRVSTRHPETQGRPKPTAADLDVSAAIHTVSGVKMTRRQLLKVKVGIYL